MGGGSGSNTNFKREEGRLLAAERDRCCRSGWSFGCFLTEEHLHDSVPQRQFGFAGLIVCAPASHQLLIRSIPHIPYRYGTKFVPNVWAFDATSQAPTFPQHLALPQRGGVFSLHGRRRYQSRKMHSAMSRRAKPRLLAFPSILFESWGKRCDF